MVFALHIMKEGKNPSVQEMALSPKKVKFTYKTDKKTAKALGIPSEGEMEFSLTCCVPDQALKSTFVIKDENPSSEWHMGGVYYAKVGSGKLMLRKNAKPAGRPEKREKIA